MHLNFQHSITLLLRHSENIFMILIIFYLYNLPIQQYPRCLRRKVNQNQLY
ncbi:hypothetical protein BDV38DRAFT_199551 [Aspergillus pseudotamarii]|uniref:Uncharacterized protein n=1 Tax=Aspergillus pseudotamarii TaxID=132259 RepID=A0A5N6SH95_ASPPS|nr:uncharacterized protein BDV38DRAFT_199551 [Aspergillus pseudotamarii]KAE8132773.1 hypothetical protein BDV38DRAFT_199551 [Aspergillus pseudotamarii]